MLPLYLSPAPRFPHQALAGQTTNFGLKILGWREPLSKQQIKDPWATAEEFPNTDPVDSTHRTSKRKGGLEGKHPREGRGFDRIGNRCNRGEGLRWLMHQCKHWSPLNQCSPKGTSEMACQDFLLIYRVMFRDSLGLSRVVCCIPRRQWRRKASIDMRPKRHRLDCYCFNDKSKSMRLHINSYWAGI